MTSDPPVVATKAWKVQMGSLVAVSVEGDWHRGLAVTRLDQNFSIYLVDLGRTVLKCTHSDSRASDESWIVIFRHYLDLRSLGNLRACCLP